MDVGAKFIKKGLRVETYVDENGEIFTKSFEVEAEITFLYKIENIYTAEVITFDGRRIVNNGVLYCRKYQQAGVNFLSTYKFNKNFTKGKQIFLQEENNVSIAETFNLKRVN
jgi:hypothetical protein